MKRSDELYDNLKTIIVIAETCKEALDRGEITGDKFDILFHNAKTARELLCRRKSERVEKVAA